jgi:predicted esterase
MHLKRSIQAIAILIATMLPIPIGMAQARQTLALAHVIYNTMKTTARPQGELKAKIDAIDQELGEASRLGRTGEVRRLLSKGTALLSGREWTDAIEFSKSLVLRAPEVFIDSGQPYLVRLEQIYPSRLALASSPTARVSLHKPQRLGRLVQAGEKIRDLATLDAVSRDLLDEPAIVELDLSAVADGPAVIQIELFDGQASLGAALLTVEIQKGLHERMRRIEEGLRVIRGFESYRADVLYPRDFVSKVNRGKIEPGGFDLAKELSLAEQILSSLREGKAPYSGRTGDMERHYFLEGAGEIMPYRLYIPPRYTGKEPYPLIIALHGLGGNEDSFFDGYGKQVPKLAEQHGYIVAAPLGYRVDGAYGMSLFGTPQDPAVARKLELSEKDVMNVLALVKKNYKIDENRIFLMGHSMGALGTWHLGAKYPEIWAGLAPFAGLGSPSRMARMRQIPEIVIHGDADPTVRVEGSRAMVAEMKKLGVEHQYIEVAGGNHIDIVAPNLPAVFQFFDKHPKLSTLGR